MNVALVLYDRPEKPRGLRRRATGIAMVKKEMNSDEVVVSLFFFYYLINQRTEGAAQAQSLTVNLVGKLECTAV